MHNRFLFTLILALWTAGAAAAGNISLQQIKQIADGGAPGLALTLLDEQHPSDSDGFAAWYRWSKARTDILVGWKQWGRAQQYLQELPENLPEPLRRWALSQRAWLALEQGDAALSRTLLRELIWLAGEREQDPTEGALWRRLIIRGYLVEDNLTDAATAMHRYQQDYPSDRPEWLQLQAEILLRQKRPDVILDWPETLFTQLPLALRLLVELRGGQTHPGTLLDQTLPLAKDDTTDVPLRARYWKIAAEASVLLGDLLAASTATEEALRLAHHLPAGDRLFAVGPLDWWRAYESYGVSVANRNQLLFGDDAAWFAVVRSLLPAQPEDGKALLVVMSKEATSESRRRQALVMLAATFKVIGEDDSEIEAINRDNLELVARLFLDNERFPNLQAVPSEVRYRLLEHSLSTSDIDTASNLMATLSEQPQDADPFDWSLRRARVMVMGGRPDQGAEVLNTLLDEQLFIDPEQLDKFMQVLFDLQSSGHQKQALALFARLEKERQLAPKQRRELFFWIAESLSATEQYAQAALYFMRSATYVDASGNDLWGQSARYSAADALSKAGLISDARRVYRELLAITEDPARQAVLRGKLQQLWVTTKNTGDVVDP